MIRRNDTQYSRFWMGGDEFEFDPKRDFDAWDTDTLLRLASFKRAVANFVRIVTGKNIPVLYNTGEQSYTDGKHVVLSAKLEHNQFDTAVGTALHEATHCVLSDFGLSTYMKYYQTAIAEVYESRISGANADLEFRMRSVVGYSDTHNSYIATLMDGVDSDLVMSLYTRLFKIYGDHALALSWLWKMSKLMENWVEDRRIDYFQFTTSPGYKGYYNAMYSSYFWSKLTGKAIRAKNYRRTETWESYKFRIINLLHPDADLDALKGLREIWNLLDIHNISRLTSSLDSWNLGYKIIDVILNHIEAEKSVEADDEQSTPTSGKGTANHQYDDDVDENTPEPSDDDESGDGEGAARDNDTGDEDLDTADGEGSPFGDDDESTDDGDDSGEESDDSSDSEGDNESKNVDLDDAKDGDKEGSDGDNLSESQKKRMEKEEKKQDDFLNGTVQKKKMSKQAGETMKSLEEGGVSLSSTGQGLLDSSGNPVKIQCVVIKNITKELMDSGAFPDMFYPSDGYEYYVTDNQKAVEDGFRLGAMLGKRLQVRNESRTTKFNRLETGRIDKKLLASLGYQNNRVFFRTMVDKFNPMMLHISVDASGSMSGKKWHDTLVLLTAIVKAASMTTNLNVVVSMRGTTSGANTSAGRGRRRYRWSRRRVATRTTAGYSISTRPLIAIVYDSRVDKLSKVRSLFSRIYPGGATPEGLAFEPIIDEMVVGKSGEIESIFVNISDGQPCFSANVSTGNGESTYFEYGSGTGATHTAAMVQKMRSLNIKILSYIISDGYRDHDWEVFKRCYGKDARKIDTNNIVELAKTMNEKFLEKVH